MNLSKVAKRAFLSITAAFALVLCLTLGAGTAHAAVVVDKTISAAGGSITFSYTTQASITNLSSKPAWLSVSSRMNSASSVTYTITASANPNCNSRSFDLCFSGTNETYRITQYGLGHNYSVYEKTNPTCTSYGHECFKCSRCESRTQGNQLPILPHTYSTKRVEPTASSTGYEKKYCTVCGYVAYNNTLYKVTYSANGGSDAPVAQTKIYGKDLTLSSSEPKRTGYKFKGWGTTAKATSVAYAKGATYKSNSNITLYAIWEINTYSVVYNIGANATGKPGSQTKTYGKDLTLSSSVPKKTGYTFKGWDTDSKALKVVYGKGAVYKNNSGVTLYAVWEINTYSVVYNIGANATGKPGNQTKTYGKDLTLSSSEPKKTGYTFKGWDTDNKALKVVYGKGAVYKGNSNVTLYAVWEVNSYTVTYKTQGGSIDNDTDKKVYNEGLQLKKPSRGGCNFIGWSIKANSADISYLPEAIYTTNADVTLYAVWTFTVTYDTNGGIWEENPSKVREQTKTSYKDIRLIEEVPYRDGYRFVGWGTAKDIDHIMFNPGALFGFDRVDQEDMVLYAHWEPYRIRFDGNYSNVSGVPFNGAQVAWDISELKKHIPEHKPSRSGATFYAWNTKPDGTGINIYPGDGFDWLVNNVDITLYAIWIPDYELCSFDGGYSYKYEGSISNTLLRIKLKIPDKYAGYYKLICSTPGVECWIEDQYGVDCYANGNADRWVRRSDRTGYYAINSNQWNKDRTGLLEHYVVIQRSASTSSSEETLHISLTVQSEYYHQLIPCGEEKLNSSFIWKAHHLAWYAPNADMDDYLSKDEIWEVYLCPEDVASWMTIYDFSKSLDSEAVVSKEDFKNFFINKWLKKDVFSFAKDSLDDKAQEINEKLVKTVSEVLSNIILGSERSIPGIGLACSLVKNVAESYKDYKNTHLTTYERLTMRTSSGYLRGDVANKADMDAGAEGTGITFKVKNEQLTIVGAKKDENGENITLPRDQQDLLVSKDNEKTWIMYVKSDGTPNEDGSKSINIPFNYYHPEKTPGVHFTVAIDFNGNPTIITEKSYIHSWDGEAITMRPGVLGSFDTDVKSINKAMEYINNPNESSANYEFLPADLEDVEHYEKSMRVETHPSYSSKKV